MSGRYRELFSSVKIIGTLLLLSGLMLWIQGCRGKSSGPSIVWVSTGVGEKFSDAADDDISPVQVDTPNTDLDVEAQTSSSDDLLTIPASEGSSIPFPKLNFFAQNVPAATSDEMSITFPLSADPAYSHYAMKYGTSNDCSTSKGYSVYEVGKAVVVEQESLPLGPIHLCLIAYHFPSKRWQAPKEALVYTWQKVPLKRTIQTSYDVLIEVGCPTPTRVRYRARIDIDGDRGTYRSTLANPGQCTVASGPITNRLAEIKVTGTRMEGKFFDAGVEGWFKFQFNSPERTSFTGTWGLANAPLVTEGYWNSDL